MIAREVYRLTLRHEIIDENGKHYPLDEPLLVENYILRDEGVAPAWVLNEMFDKLKAEVIARKGE